MQLPPDVQVDVHKSDNLPAENEEAVCEAPERWLEFNPESPSQYVNHIKVGALGMTKEMKVSITASFEEPCSLNFSVFVTPRYKKSSQLILKCGPPADLHKVGQLDFLTMTSLEQAVTLL